MELNKFFNPSKLYIKLFSILGDKVPHEKSIYF